MNDGFERSFRGCIQRVGKQNTEAGKAYVFLKFISSAFKGSDANFLSDLDPIMEKGITSKRGVQVRGRPDALLGNLLIEFEVDLDRKREEAVEQLARYTSILWTNQGKNRVKYLAVASDGINFDVYKPRTEVMEGEVTPQDVDLEELEREVKLSSMKPEQAYLWLDRYFLYSTKIPPTGDEFSARYGSKSPAYREAQSILSTGWQEAELVAAAGCQEWKRCLRFVYGTEVAGEDLFLRHTYLATVAKLTVYLYYGEIPSREEILEVLRGGMFARNWGLLNSHRGRQRHYLELCPEEPVQTAAAKKGALRCDRRKSPMALLQVHRRHCIPRQDQADDEAVRNQA
jgi:hypothetical protein